MMKGLRFSAVLTAMLVLSAPSLSAPAFAAFNSGNDLLKYCSAQSGNDRGVCYGYVEGVTDVMGDQDHPAFGYTACLRGLKDVTADRSLTW
jgi:hypothetical protein